jgi:hypothetical protein
MNLKLSFKNDGNQGVCLREPQHLGGGDRKISLSSILRVGSKSQQGLGV